MPNDIAIENGQQQTEAAPKVYPYFEATVRKFKYNFKTEALTDENDKVIEESKLKRTSIELEVAVPNIQELIEKLTLRGPEAELIIEGVHQVIFNQGRVVINKLLEEDKIDYDPETKVKQYGIVLTPDLIDRNKLSLNYIANLPPAERRGGGIAKETWDSFVGDYKDVMAIFHKKRHDESLVAHSQDSTIRVIEMKTPEQINNAAQQFFFKYNKCKTNKTVLKVLKGLLNTWFATTENKEEFADVYELLDKKVDTLLQVDEAALLANL